MRIITGALLTSTVLLLSACGAGSPTASVTAPGVTRPAVSTPSAPAGAPSALPRPDRKHQATLFYFQYDGEAGRLVKLVGTSTRTVLRGDGANLAEVSPDGRRIAYVTGTGDPSAGDLMVGDSDGGRARKVRSGVVPFGYGPTWSGDGASLVIALPGDDGYRHGIIRVADRRFTALPASTAGLHQRLTRDGSRVFWSNGRCHILSAKVDGTDVREVPGLGLDTDSTENPMGLSACDIVSLNDDGSRMTVALRQRNSPGGDAGGDIAADTVIDTATGKPLRLPISGEVQQVLFRADGTLIVRTESKGKFRLTQLSADLTVLGSRAEPAALAGLVLTDAA